MAPTDNVPPNIEPENKLQSIPSLASEATKSATQDNIHPPMSSESPTPNTGNGITDGLMQTAPPAIPQMNKDDSIELHGITNTVPVEYDCNVAQQITAQSSDSSENVLLKAAMNSPEPRPHLKTTQVN